MIAVPGARLAEAKVEQYPFPSEANVDGRTCLGPHRTETPWTVVGDVAAVDVGLVETSDGFGSLLGASRQTSLSVARGAIYRKAKWWEYGPSRFPR